MTEEEAEIRISLKRADAFSCPKVVEQVVAQLNVNVEEATQIFTATKQYLVYVAVMDFAGRPYSLAAEKVQSVLDIFRQHEAYNDFCLVNFSRVI